MFSSDRMQDSLVSKLARAMLEGVQTGEDGLSIAPNQYLIHVSPSQAEHIKSNSLVLVELSRYLQQAGKDADLVFQDLPTIRIIEDQSLDNREVVVTALSGETRTDDTLDYKVDDEVSEVGIPPGAFLIVDGVQIYPLNEKIINIGRRVDNQLVIEDSRVSRLHAQMRVVSGRYIIFDLNSSGGTYVNGVQVEKCSLRPGDVISLSGVPLVYGQEAMDAGDTQQIDISPIDHG